MSKVTYADEIRVANCECCGGVQIQLLREGELFALACPADLDSAVEISGELQAAVQVMGEGKPHVH
ncbi:hypothetical protein [Aquamicrobium defluvii]|uniref:Uncharacterized protein n=1 Tax=Aquamicrobium defluvii TaxID=69279 RepID=A0A4R6YH54_9HYPH|nr:hypothetical protein [Aquamicrobium defluvii]TDR35715.1 hypothetical protein DES43_108140 [Aquamicrobium defluvii]